MYVCERYLSYVWNSAFNSRCVRVCAVVCNTSVFCSDVRGEGVSVIHREQLHAGLREKPSRENVFKKK